MSEEPIGPRVPIQKKRIRSNKDDLKEEKELIPEKVIYCELDEEITQLFDRIAHTKCKTIGVVVPRRAMILDSVINLKILHKKVTELGKTVIIVTIDESGRELAKKAGFAATPQLVAYDRPKESHEPKPLELGGRPVRTAHSKVSIADVIRTEVAPLGARVINKLKELIKKRKKNASGTRLVFIAPNKQALFTLVLVSVLLLVAIAYIALPGATIHLTPKSTVLESTFNVTLLDAVKNPSALDITDTVNIIIPAFPVVPPVFEKKVIHKATGKIFQGQRATGVLTVTNTTENAWQLITGTRFQTDSGLVFRSTQAVTIPASKGTVYGILEVPVIADEFDETGQVVGSRGNISPSTFFLPGLKTEESRKKLYAQSTTAFSGGTNETTKTVTKEDIAAVEQAVVRDIARDASSELKQFLERDNIMNKRNLSLLDDKNAISISKPQILIPNDIEGKPMEQFEVTIKYQLRGLAYDRQGLVQLMKKRIINRVDPDKKLVSIDENDIGYRFLDKDDSAGRLRVTATLRAVQIFELDPEKENGRRFLKKVTDHIVGLRIKEAQEYLQQQTDQIAKVSISLWPVWAPTIPNVGDNIKFVIEEYEIEKDIPQ